MTVFLSRGACGREVRVLQESLAFQLGVQLKTDGSWGPETEKWLRRYQTNQGLEATGVCDHSTWEHLRLGLCPPERHVQLLLPWSLLQIREGNKVLFASPYNGSPGILQPGFFRLEQRGKGKEKNVLCVLNKRAVLCTAPDNKKKNALHLRGNCWENTKLSNLLKGVTCCIVNPLASWPDWALVTEGGDDEQIADKLGISRYRLRKSIVSTGLGTVIKIPICRPPWPSFFAVPTGDPQGWEPWLPWLRGVFIYPEQEKTWAGLAKEHSLSLFRIVPGGREKLPRHQSWCYQAKLPADLVYLAQLKGRQKGISRAISLETASLASEMPASLLGVDWYILASPLQDFALAMKHVRRHLSPTKLLLAAPGTAASGVAQTVKSEGLAGIVFTSPPDNHDWLKAWIEF
ncbi:MAG: peptidoglycan-binding protein [Firmicutes bacterium]|nr:peptidoglycan-binding protein [Bacillota bacterium]